MPINARILLFLTKVKGGEQAHRWQRIRLRDRLLLLTKAFTCASLECGASSAFDSDPGGVPDVPDFNVLNGARASGQGPRGHGRERARARTVMRGKGE